MQNKNQFRKMETSRRMVLLFRNRWVFEAIWSITAQADGPISCSSQITHENFLNLPSQGLHLFFATLPLPLPLHPPPPTSTLPLKPVVLIPTTSLPRSCTPFIQKLARCMNLPGRKLPPSCSTLNKTLTKLK